MLSIENMFKHFAKLTAKHWWRGTFLVKIESLKAGLYWKENTIKNPFLKILWYLLEQLFSNVTYDNGNLMYRCETLLTINDVKSQKWTHFKSTNRCLIYEEMCKWTFFVKQLWPCFAQYLRKYLSPSSPVCI